MRINNSIIIIIVVYIALYSTIWLHEFGHALFYYGYGCKTDLFQLDVPFHFAAAGPGRIDPSCHSRLNNHQVTWAAIGGIMANLILASVSYFIIRRFQLSRKVFLFIVFFILSNLVEAASYLTISNIYPMGDITTVNSHIPILCIPMAFIGVLLIFILARFIKTLEKPLRIGATIFCISTILCMFVLRFYFTET